MSMDSKRQNPCGQRLSTSWGSGFLRELVGNFLVDYPTSPRERSVCYSGRPEGLHVRHDRYYHTAGLTAGL